MELNDIVETLKANGLVESEKSKRRLLGKFMPSKRPVMMAEPSSKLVSSFRRYFVIAHSKKTQAATEVSSTTAEPRPKK